MKVKEVNMKKIIKLFFVFGLFLLSGCGIKNATNVLKDLEKQLKNAKTYYLEGTMEIINHEDTYTYNVKVSYQKEDYYKIELMNTLNNHEQVILRNDDGVYVDTHKRYNFKILHNI